MKPEAAIAIRVTQTSCEILHGVVRYSAWVEIDASKIMTGEGNNVEDVGGVVHRERGYEIEYPASYRGASSAGSSRNPRRGSNALPQARPGKTGSVSIETPSDHGTSGGSGSLACGLRKHRRETFTRLR